jgi:hypothetical protein
MADSPLPPGASISDPPGYFWELKTDPHERSQWLLEVVVDHNGPHRDLTERLLASVMNANPTALKSALLEVSAIVLTTEEAQSMTYFEIILPENVLATPPPNPVTWSYESSGVLLPDPLAPGWSIDQLVGVSWPQDYLWAQEMVVLPSTEWWIQLWMLALNPPPALDQVLHTINQVHVAELFTKHRLAYKGAMDDTQGFVEPDDVPSGIGDLFPFLREMLNGPAPFRYDLFACAYNFGALFRPNRVSLDAAFFDLAPVSVQPLVTSATGLLRVINLLGRYDEFERLQFGGLPPRFASQWASVPKDFFSSRKNPTSIDPNLLDGLLRMIAFNEDATDRMELLQITNHIRICEANRLGANAQIQPDRSCPHIWADAIMHPPFGFEYPANLRASFEDANPERRHWAPMRVLRRRAARVRLFVLWFGLMFGGLKKKRLKYAMLAPDGAWGRRFMGDREDAGAWGEGARKAARLE